MSTIGRLTPGEVHRSLGLVAPTSTPPRIAFSDFLSSRESGNGHAFGFSELGVFGTAHALSFSLAYAGETMSPSAPLIDGHGPKAPASTTPQSIATSVALTSEINMGASFSIPVSAMEQGDISSALPQSVNVPFEQSIPGQALTVDDEGLPSSAQGVSRLAQARHADPGRSSHPALVVTAWGQSLQVVARGQDDTMEARARLRRLLQDTAASFGLHIGDFQFNGTVSLADFSGLLGGSHRNRTS